MADMKTDKVRQGRSGKPVLFVLIGGLVLALIAFAGLGFFNAAQPDQSIGGAANSGTTTAPSTSAGSTTTTVSPGETRTDGTAAPAN